MKLIQHNSIESKNKESEIPIDLVKLLMEKKEPFNITHGDHIRDGNMFCMYSGSGNYNGSGVIDHYVWMTDYLHDNNPKLDSTIRIDRKNSRVLAEPGIGGITGRDSYREDDTYLSTINMEETLNILDDEGFTFHQITRFHDYEFLKNLKVPKNLSISAKLQQLFQKTTGMHEFEGYLIEKDITLKDVISGNYKTKTAPAKVDNSFIENIKKDW